MIWRAAYLLLSAVAILLLLVNSERHYRELQSLQARQAYQKQVLLEEQSRLRLELQQVMGETEANP